MDEKPSYEDLERIVQAAIDTLTTIDDWLGMACSRGAAQDAMWRLRMMLKDAGYTPPVDDLEWRGSLIHALERNGWRASVDGDIRQLLPGQKSWELAKGITLAEYMQQRDQALKNLYDDEEDIYWNSNHAERVKRILEGRRD